jgi:hypothetical protein
LTADRATVMRLHVREDGSVAERTDSFLVHAIQSVEPATDAVVSARVGDRTITVPVSEEFGAALASARRRDTTTGTTRPMGGQGPRSRPSS